MLLVFCFFSLPSHSQPWKTFKELNLPPPFLFLAFPPPVWFDCIFFYIAASNYNFLPFSQKREIILCNLKRPFLPRILQLHHHRRLICGLSLHSPNPAFSFGWCYCHPALSFSRSQQIKFQVWMGSAVYESSNQGFFFFFSESL